LEKASRKLLQLPILTSAKTFEDLGNHFEKWRVYVMGIFGDAIGLFIASFGESAVS
jgi:hypothetical protein